MNTKYYSTNYAASKKNLRMKKIFKIRCTLAMTIIFISLISLLSVFPAKAKTTANDYQTNANKCYKSVQIQKGDSLWSIAQENINYNYYTSIKSYLNEIKTTNSLKSNTLIAGSYIIVPYYTSND